MSRIFAALAVFSTLLLCAALGFGVWIGQYNENYAAYLSVEQRMSVLPGDDVRRVQLSAEREDLYQQMEEPRRRARTHMLLGILRRACRHPGQLHLGDILHRNRAMVQRGGGHL